MSNWFTSDTHWNHKNVIKYCNRPFKQVCNVCDGTKEDCAECNGDGFFPLVEEMNEKLIENWNKVVKPNDQVYHLGDLIFASKKAHVTELFKRLNGHIHWIYGNHDKSFRNAPGAAWQGDYKEVKINKQKFILSHYPFMSWNGQHNGTVMLHGHCHGNLKHNGTDLLIDVGTDCWNYTPAHVDEIMAEVEKIKAKNLNEHGKEILTRDHH